MSFFPFLPTFVVVFTPNTFHVTTQNYIQRLEATYCDMTTYTYVVFQQDSTLACWKAKLLYIGSYQPFNKISMTTVIASKKKIIF